MCKNCAPGTVWASLTLMYLFIIVLRRQFGWRGNTGTKVSRVSPHGTHHELRNHPVSHHHHSCSNVNRSAMFQLIQYGDHNGQRCYVFSTVYIPTNCAQPKRGKPQVFPHWTFPISVVTTLFGPSPLPF